MTPDDWHDRVESDEHSTLQQAVVMVSPAELYLQVIVGGELPLILAPTERERDRARLTALLIDGRFEFRSFDVLKRVVSIADPDYVEELLGEIGARQASRDPDLYGLISRVGPEPREEFPDIIHFRRN